MLKYYINDYVGKKYGHLKVIVKSENSTIPNAFLFLCDCGKKVTLAKLDYLYFFEDRIAFFKKINNSVLMNKARLQYLHSLIWEFSRVKDILRDDHKLQYVIKQYRNYYKLGDFNSKFKYESKVYMYIFYVSPYLFDLIQKVQGRFLNG